VELHAPCQHGCYSCYIVRALLYYIIVQSIALKKHYNNITIFCLWVKARLTYLIRMITRRGRVGGFLAGGAKGLYISDLNNMTIHYFYILFVSLFLFLSRIISHICVFLFVEREPKLVL
jgi:hypothetical protein